MNAKDIRIVFMGTPEFAVPSLRALVEQGYNVVGVVTTPDRAAGRGQKLYECDVKVEVQRLGLPILQPEKLKSEEFIEALRGWAPDLGIVIAFRMLPEVVWAMPRFGTFNLHASLLPQYRGAAPINHAIINGDKVSGVTTFLLNHEIDKGAIIGQIEVDIAPEDNVGSLYEKLMNIGTGLILDSVEKIASGNVEPIEQDDVDPATLRPAPKIFKEDCKINWKQSGEQIVNFVRGLSPYPAAWTPLFKDGTETSAKIFEVSFEPSASTAEIGSIECNDKSRLAVKCNDGFIVIKTIQLAGKKRLSVKDLLLGLKGLSTYKALV
ncbi:MAG: methionyl-tRNA formyltransferase [Rikenellaceae bacterium]